MEYFKSGLKSVLGAPQPGAQPSGAETVERLVDRVQSSTLLDDRRDACRALKALSRKYRVEVGAQGMDALRQVLEMDHNDCEIVGYVLDTLCNITSPEVFEEEERPDLSHESLMHVGEQFTEIFIKKPENVGLVLSFMEEYEFQVRWPAVKLLTTLLANKPRDIQEIILVSPMGVSKMMDLLGDSRDVIRNEVWRVVLKCLHSSELDQIIIDDGCYLVSDGGRKIGDDDHIQLVKVLALLLLIQLTKGNANIQKIVAFENAFDRLFEVIKEEGGADGGIVVEDCLLLMLNLLRNNTSNQNFYKEGSYIQRLAPMFTLPPEGEDAGWSSQKVANIHCVLQILRTLVSPGNPAQVTASCQRALHASGILEALCHMLMAGGVPVDTLTETICALAEAIRGNHGNQQYFTSVMAPSTPPREAIVVLLMSMVNEKQPFLLRCAVLYCFQCFLFQNEEGQRQLVKTLLPSTTEVVNLSSGQLLCGGLFSHDPLSNWFSAIALSHSLIENPEQREELLRVLLAANTGNTPVSLLHQASELLQHSSKVQSKLGLLMLLCTWLAHCPAAVKQFLSISSSIPYLIAQAGSTERDENEELVQGVCAFLIGICVQFNDESVTNLTKENLRHLIEKRIGHEVFLAKLGEVSRHEQYSKASKHPELKPRSAAELLLDHEFCKLFKALEGMIIKTVTAKAAADLLNGDMELSPAESAMVLQYKDLIREQDKRLHDLQLTVDSLRHENNMLAAQNQELNNSMDQLRDQNMVLRAQVSSGGINTEGDKTAELWAELENKESIIKRLNEELNEVKINSSLQKTAIAESSSQNTEELQRLRDELSEAHQRISELTDESVELARLKRDQEDLLELLADQDAKLGNFKVRLRALGEKVDEDEDQDLDDDVDSPNEEQTSQSLA